MVLDYDPTTDILKVDWPNIETYQLAQVQQTLQTLVDYIRNYDVKYLLIDASQATSNPELVETPEYKKMIFEFVSDLTKTRLKKSARISAGDTKREAKTQKLTKEVIQETNLIIQSKDFSNKEEAKAWLLA
jgi:hypothetical protein